MFTRIGIVIKNQTVLIKGINDAPSVLGNLLKRTYPMWRRPLLYLSVQASYRRERTIPGPIGNLIKTKKFTRRGYKK